MSRILKRGDLFRYDSPVEISTILPPGLVRRFVNDDRPQLEFRATREELERKRTVELVFEGGTDAFLCMLGRKQQ